MNKIKEVLQCFDLEINEEFRLEGKKTKFRFNEYCTLEYNYRDDQWTNSELYTVMDFIQGDLEPQKQKEIVREEIDEYMTAAGFYRVR